MKIEEGMCATTSSVLTSLLLTTFLRPPSFLFASAPLSPFQLSLVFFLFISIPFLSWAPSYFGHLSPLDPKRIYSVCVCPSSPTCLHLLFSFLFSSIAKTKIAIHFSHTLKWSKVKHKRKHLNNLQDILTHETLNLTLFLLPSYFNS